jgi:hypothetical protein
VSPSIRSIGWPISPGRRSILQRIRPLVPAQFGIVDLLWQIMAGGFPDVAIAVRDTATSGTASSSIMRSFTSTSLRTRRFSSAPIGVLVLRDHAAAGVELCLPQSPNHLITHSCRS